MTERRSSVLAVPLSGHVYGSRKRSSVSGGGLGAIRAEIVREPAASLHSIPSVPSIEEEGEDVANADSYEGQSPKAVQKRRMSSISSAPKSGTISSMTEEEGEEDDDNLSNSERQSPGAVPKRRMSSVSLHAPPEFHAPNFGAPVFRMPGFEQPETPFKTQQTNGLPATNATPGSHSRDRTQSIAFVLPEPTRSLSPTLQRTKETEISSTFRRRASTVRIRQKSTLLPAYIQEAEESTKRRTRQKWVSHAFRYTYYLLCVL